METEEGYSYAALQFSFLLAVVFLGQTFLDLKLGFNPSQSPAWKFLASFLAHSGPEHLLNNLFFIALFGSIYELHTSSKEFYKAFLLSALFANLSAFLFYPESIIIGASGGAMGVLAALTVYRPNQVGLVLGVPAPMYMVLIAYILINFVGLSASTGVAYEAHLMGIIAGSLLGYRQREKALLQKEDSDQEEKDWEQKIREWEEKYMK
ncbi:MAG: rhomboid family intramembrane serine protease [Candidatus Nanohalobium sp.]